MIKLANASLQRGLKVLLQDANLTIHVGDKWGVIGPNGSGKSSLFQLLTGKLAVDSGELAIPAGWQIAHMAQEVGAGDRTAIDYVQDGDKELRAIEEAMANSGDDGERLANLYSQYEHIDGYTAKARAEQLLAGLGFAPGDGERPVSSFSGGWRIRLNLAQALMCRSDLLLLDEPTNHLDLDATLWLEQRLRSYAGTLLIISHDRDFLDNVVTSVVNLEQQTLVSYSGNYSAYERQKAERLAQQQSAFEKQQERIAEIENFVRRFKAKASKAKQAQSRVKELERMEQLSPAHVDSPFTFRFPEPGRVPQQLVTLSQANLGYPGKTLLANVNLSLHGNSRLGLLGANGAGKSTLMKALVGSDSSTLQSGDRVEGAHLNIGYFNQHQLEALDLDASCALHLQRLTPKASEQSIRNFLGSFDFMGDRAFEPIRHFSGGEKARLALAILAWQKPNLLLLDEPTNHLDLEVRHALTIALQAFEGAVVLVSHDRHLLRNTVDAFLLVDDGKVELFDGDLEDYERWLGEKRKLQDGSAKPTSAKNDQDAKGDSKKAQRQNSAALRAQLKPLTNAVKKLESEMDKLQKSLTAVEAELADPAIYETGGEKLEQTIKKQAQLREQLEMCEEQWMLKSEELEALTDS